MALYNEIDAHASQWLRNLVDAGHIAPGVVDERSIKSLQADDLRGHVQCHFFAGIGVWSHALRLAGWPDDRPVWTGSCPCQPFSVAGKGLGFADPRHLWPDWFRLIRECRPPTIFGEQVAGKDGAAWLDLVQADLEGAGYAFGAAVLPAAGVGAPHMRHRIYWVAYAGSTGLPWARPQIARCCDLDSPRRTKPWRRCHARWVGESAGEGLAGRARERGDVREEQSASERAVSQPGPVNGFWADAEWIPCRDGKCRPAKPGIFPLAHGTPGRVGRLRAYGNAIVAQVAATFIETVMHALDALEDTP